MRRSLIKISLLAAFVLWATGAAQFAHECIVHGGGRAVSPAQRSLGAKPLLSHTDDDCAVCAALTGMTVHQGVADPPIVRLRLAGLATVFVAHGVRNRTFEQYLRSRAPPVSSSIPPDRRRTSCRSPSGNSPGRMEGKRLCAHISWQSSLWHFL